MKTSTITRHDQRRVEATVTPSSTGEVQGFEHVQPTTLALDATAALASVESLQQLLADTITLRDLYKKAPLAGFGRHVLHAASAVRQARGGAV